MPDVHLVSSPGDAYLDEVLHALNGAVSFVLITAFASASGIALLAPAIQGVLARGGQGRIILAVDRQGFNTASVFEALLSLKQAQGDALSVGIVLEGAGLLHAKALFTHGPQGDRLIVGSANLTRHALGTNHELGLLVTEPTAELRRAFHRFADSIAPKALDSSDARAFLEARGLLAPRSTRTPSATTPGVPSLASILGAMAPLAPLELPADEHLAAWIGQGYLVGRGRRSLDALVLRVPHEQLARLGHLRPPKREVLGMASHETRTMGYGVDLIPTVETEVLRRAAARVTRLLAKLTLALPCFGHWMPESYWEVFLAARQRLQGASVLDPDAVRALAIQHRTYLEQGGLEREVDQILRRLEELALLVPGHGPQVRTLLLTRFATELRLRTPHVLAGCVEFRTARQRWSPHERTEAPYRQLMVDVIQATFAATYRTGDWPRRFPSHASRQISSAIESHLTLAGRPVDGATALELLTLSATWEDPSKPLAEALEEFRRLVGDNMTFPAPDVDVLTAVAGEEAGEDERNDDDGSE